MLMNQTVTIHSSIGEPIVGVIGSKPPHVTKPEERNKVVKADDMFIDIGAKDKEDAEKMIRIGDKMTFNSLFEEYPNNLIMGKALDNRVGCYVMMEVLKSRHQSYRLRCRYSSGRSWFKRSKNFCI